MCPRLDTSTSVHPERNGSIWTASSAVRRPLIVEIGPGTGESLVPMARARPECNVLAFEVYQPAIARIGRERWPSNEVDNVRLVAADAVAGLTPPAARARVDELWTFFPDPWPKARHHKRRLLSPDFVELVVSRLKTGRRWRLATDWTGLRRVDAQGMLDDHPRPGG